MKKFEDYIVNGCMKGQKAAFDRVFFLRELQRLADEATEGDLVLALGKYLRDPQYGPFEKVEQGTLALYLDTPRNVITATVSLFRALEVQPDQAAQMNVYVDYFGFSPEHESEMWAMSWQVESEMQWPIGTLYPRSKYLWQVAVGMYQAGLAPESSLDDHEVHVVRFIEVEARELASMPAGEATRLLVACLEGTSTAS